MRVFWTADRGQVASAIRHLVQYDIPVIGIFDNRPIVQRSDCSAEEEILLILHHSGEDGLNRTELGRSVMKSPAAVTRALSSLASSSRREIIKLQNGKFTLTDVGVRRILGELGEKMAL